MSKLTRVLLYLALSACGAIAQSQRSAFEVVSIKPAPPPGRGATAVGCQGGPGSSDPGRLTCSQMSPEYLIGIAYGVKYFQLIGPDWLATPKFEVIATLPAGTTKEHVMEMWRNLLADRFHLAVHHETREATHFDLVVAKNGPKLTTARADSGPPPMATLGRRADGFHMHMPRITMDGLAGMLAGQLQQEVANATGLDGKYDVALQWMPDTAAAATDDNAAGVPALPQALQEQLGLKLEAKKGPVDRLVIDHIDRTPTEN